MRMGIAFAAALGVGLAASAAAQSGASWASGDGGLTTLMLSGSGNEPPPAPQPLTAGEMAQLFKRVCLDTAGHPAAIAAAIAEGKLELTPTPAVLAATKKQPEVTLGVWRGPGMVAAQTSGFRVVPEGQCNITFYPAELPDRAVLAEALSALVGSAPENAAEAVKKNGEPNKRFAPRWSLARAEGAPLRVNAIVMRGHQYMPGDRVLVALTGISQ